ncbi:MAG: protein TolR [Deltaproteobacteria bacterium]|nr:protein TolR [Deltaproteobacteria bacterium]
MHLGGGGVDAASRPGRRTSATLSEINVTPLVDVMLVLLIVFMVSAPLMQQGVQVDLPKAAAQALDDQQDQIVLVITAEKKLLLNKNEIRPREFRTKLAAIYQNKTSKEIFIQADQDVPYGFVAQIMAEVKRAGISKVGLVTEPPKPGEQ